VSRNPQTEARRSSGRLARLDREAEELQREVNELAARLGRARVSLAELRAQAAAVAAWPGITHGRLNGAGG
jgi:chromosome segregation ATPase